MSDTSGTAVVAVEQLGTEQRELLISALLSHASVLARAGHLDRAAAVLAGVVAGDTVDIRVLDLLAKVRAQQGRYQEARALWTKARDLSGSEAYGPALRRIDQLSKKSSWLLSMPIVAAVILVAGLAVLVALAPWKGRAIDAPALSGEAPERLPQTPRAPDRGAVPMYFAVPGVQQINRDYGEELTFAEGLFRAGIVLRPDGGRLLDLVGARLRGVPEGTIVILTGHTDNLPVTIGKQFPDNSALGLARAIVVMRRLAAASALPMSSFLIGTGGGATGPFPNDTRENRVRNRTVTLQVRRIAPTGR